MNFVVKKDVACDKNKFEKKLNLTLKNYLNVKKILKILWKNL